MPDVRATVMAVSRPRVAAFVTALVLLSGACSGGSGEAAGVSGVPVAAAVDPDEASGPNLDVLGQGSLEGKDVVVWFWAEW